tara:strand:+ start:36 stop:176 length:141 start_codon:yes stop_codon:yes gene_type:complete
VIYRFDHNVLKGDELAISDTSIRLPGYANAVDLKIDTPYASWLSSK